MLHEIFFIRIQVFNYTEILYMLSVHILVTCLCLNYYLKNLNFRHQIINELLSVVHVNQYNRFLI